MHLWALDCPDPPKTLPRNMFVCVPGLTLAAPALSVHAYQQPHAASQNQHQQHLIRPPNLRLQLSHAATGNNSPTLYLSWSEYLGECFRQDAPKLQVCVSDSQVAALLVAHGTRVGTAGLGTNHKQAIPGTRNCGSSGVGCIRKRVGACVSALKSVDWKACSAAGSESQNRLKRCSYGRKTQAPFIAYVQQEKLPHL